MVLLLCLVLSVLFYRDCLPQTILYSNDGPLGRLMSQCHRLPDRFTGCWEDLNVLGMRNWDSAPSVSFGLLLLLKPFWFAKLYAPLALLILGLGAWCFFRRSGLAPPACLLGGLAAMLNSGFFSTACWGVAAQPIAVGMIFFALAALVDPTLRWRWLRVVLAGLATGMSVTEGADIGALFSVFVAAFVIYQASLGQGSRVKNLGVATGRVALLAVCAAWLATQAIYGLVVTEIKGVAGTQQDAQTREQRWDWATQWSLPKSETLSLIVPGLFGYRSDTPNGGDYWGAIGRNPEWDRYFENGSQGERPTGFLRFSGGGSYAGVLVSLLAVWAVAQSCVRKDSVFSILQRRWIWFWLGVSLLSLLLAYGRFAPFYRLLYALPYASTVRNPVKFMHVVAFALVVLFAYGVDGLWRRYMQPLRPHATLPRAGFRAWWGQAGKFEKWWGCGCLIALGTILLAWLAYASFHQSLEQHLQAVLFDEAKARDIAAFSLQQVGWCVLFFALAAALTIFILSGAFAGRRARWGVALLGLLLATDLGRANQPWVIYWDYQEKYASNPIIDRLREKPFEHRVGIFPFETPPELSLLGTLYQKQWLKHQFSYYNVQALEAVQTPRVPVDLAAFTKALTTTNAADYLRYNLRAWQLTNARYLLGAAGFYPTLNASSNPLHPAFRIIERFALKPRPGLTGWIQAQNVTAVPDPEGPYALYEFNWALPRAKLYANWQVNTNDQAVLDRLSEVAFDPWQTVFVAGELPSAPPAAAANDPVGKVEFASYAPKDIVLRSDALVPSVLLLNDRFDPNWRVQVDGKPERLLRCNYIMRGVYLTPGAHKIEFRFLPPVGPLYVSLVAIGVGLVLLGFLAVAGNRADSSAPAYPRRPARSQPLPQTAAAAAPTASSAGTSPPPPKGPRSAAATATHDRAKGRGKAQEKLAPK
jgi:hypothetical protein